MPGFWGFRGCCLCLCERRAAFLRNHRETVAEPLDKETNRNTCISTMEQLVAMSNINHDETFQICLDYWYSFAEKLLHEVNQEAKVRSRNVEKYSRGSTCRSGRARAKPQTGVGRRDCAFTRNRGGHLTSIAGVCGFRRELRRVAQIHLSCYAAPQGTVSAATNKALFVLLSSVVEPSTHPNSLDCKSNCHSRLSAFAPSVPWAVLLHMSLKQGGF